MTETKKYKIIYDRDNCIGPYSCVAVHPERWEESDDRKATLKEGKKEGERYVLEIELTEEELAKEMEAAQVCPVNVIHIYDKQGTKLI